jgi:hypothetical protein
MALTVNRPVRVLLLEMSQTLRDILEHAIRAHPEFELWRESTVVFGSRTSHGGDPDVVIFGATVPEDASRVTALCARWPGAQVVSVMPTNGDAAVYELRPHRTGLGQLSAAELVQALRETVRHRREVMQQ